MYIRRAVWYDDHMINDEKTCEFSGCDANATRAVRFVRSCCGAVTSVNVVCDACSEERGAPKATTCACGATTRVELRRA